MEKKKESNFTFQTKSASPKERVTQNCIKCSYLVDSFLVGKEEALEFGVEKLFTRIYELKNSFLKIVEMKNV